jgi:hypothetical protein
MSMTKTTLTRLMAISEAPVTPYAKDVAGALRDAFNDDSAVEKMAKLTRRLARFTPLAQEKVLNAIEETISGSGILISTTEPAQARAAHAVDAD